VKSLQPRTHQGANPVPGKAAAQQPGSEHTSPKQRAAEEVPFEADPAAATSMLPSTLKAFGQSTGSSSRVTDEFEGAASPLCPLVPGVLPAEHAVCPHRPSLHLARSSGGAQLGHASWAAAETRAALPAGRSRDKSCRHPTKNTYQQFVPLFKRALSPITEKRAGFKAL